VDGRDALTAFLTAQQTKQPYQLICLDIMMPDIDGKEVLHAIRDLEKASGRLPETWSKIVMTTALGDARTIGTSFHDLCDSYLVKPVDKAKLLACLRQLKLIDVAVHAA
jgi:two-component system chemotaxis response regulator CheY